MAGIPEHLIDRIRDSVNIVDVVSRYVSLKKRGRNYVGLCPFHTEKTPSFNVNPEKQIFHCFGCGVGGNVYRFLMMHENMGFVESVKQLALDTGIPLPTSPESRRNESEAEGLFKANEVANKFFCYHLDHAPPDLQDYLKRRGVNAESRKRFQIGYAPKGWDNLKQYLEKGNYDVGPYFKLGLLLKNENSGNIYDRFRQRLIFPIHNPAGKVVGFGGRQLVDEKNSPKYINSPESLVYQKSRVLYGLFFAKEAIRESGFALFVEGYTDVIQLNQAGIGNAVATSGTALTEDHARMIRRYTQQVVLCYDADQAGINAAARGGEILFQNNLEVTVLILPAGEDPDSYTRDHGKEAFLALVKKADDYLAFRVQLSRERYNLQRAGERSTAINELLDMLAPIQDALRLNFYLEKIAETLAIPENILAPELLKKQKELRRRERFGLKRREEQQPVGSSPSLPDKADHRGAPLILSGAWGGEKDILLLLLNHYSKIREYVFDHLAEADFLNQDFRQIYVLIRSQPAEVGEDLLHHVLDKIDNESVRTLLVKELFESNSEFQRPVLYMQGCIKQIKVEGYRARISLAQRRLKNLSPGEDDYRTTLKELQESMNGMKTWQSVVPSDEEPED